MPSRATWTESYGSDEDTIFTYEHFFVIRCNSCGLHVMRHQAWEMHTFAEHMKPRKKRKRQKWCSSRNFTFFEVVTTKGALSYVLMERLVAPHDQYPIMRFYPSLSDPDASLKGLPLIDWLRPIQDSL